MENNGRRSYRQGHNVTEWGRDRAHSQNFAPSSGEYGGHRRIPDDPAAFHRSVRDYRHASAPGHAHDDRRSGVLPGLANIQRVLHDGLQPGQPVPPPVQPQPRGPLHHRDPGHYFARDPVSQHGRPPQVYPARPRSPLVVEGHRESYLPYNHHHAMSQPSHRQSHTTVPASNLPPAFGHDPSVFATAGCVQPSAHVRNRPQPLMGGLPAWSHVPGQRGMDSSSNSRHRPSSWSSKAAGDRPASTRVPVPMRGDNFDSRGQPSLYESAPPPVPVPARHHDFDDPSRDHAVPVDNDDDDNFEDLVSRYHELRQTLQSLEVMDSPLAAGVESTATAAAAADVSTLTAAALSTSDRLLNEDIPLPQAPPVLSTAGTADMHSSSTPTPTLEQGGRAAHAPGILDPGRAQINAPSQTQSSTQSDAHPRSGSSGPVAASTTAGPARSPMALSDYLGSVAKSVAPDAVEDAPLLVPTAKETSGGGVQAGSAEVESKFRPFRILGGRKHNPIVIDDMELHAQGTSDSTAASHSVPAGVGVDSSSSTKGSVRDDIATSRPASESSPSGKVPLASGQNPASQRSTGSSSLLVATADVLAASPLLPPTTVANSSSMLAIQQKMVALSRTSSSVNPDDSSSSFPPVKAEDPEVSGSSPSGVVLASAASVAAAPVAAATVGAEEEALAVSARRDRRRRAKARKKERERLLRSAQGVYLETSSSSSAVPGTSAGALPPARLSASQAYLTSLPGFYSLPPASFETPMEQGQEVVTSNISKSGKENGEQAGSALVATVVDSSSGSDSDDEEDRKLTAMRERLLNSMAIKKNASLQATSRSASPGSDKLPLDEPRPNTASASLKWLNPDPVVIHLGRDTSDSSDDDIMYQPPLGGSPSPAPVPAAVGGVAGASGSRTATAPLAASAAGDKGKAGGPVALSLFSVDAMLKSVRSSVEGREKVLKGKKERDRSRVAVKEEAQRELVHVQAELARLRKKRDEKEASLAKKKRFPAISSKHASNMTSVLNGPSPVVSSLEGSPCPASSEASPAANNALAMDEDDSLAESLPTTVTVRTSAEDGRPTTCTRTQTGSTFSQPAESLFTQTMPPCSPAAVGTSESLFTQTMPPRSPAAVGTSVATDSARSGALPGMASKPSASAAGHRNALLPFAGNELEKLDRPPTMVASIADGGGGDVETHKTRIRQTKTDLSRVLVCIVNREQDLKSIGENVRKLEAELEATQQMHSECKTAVGQLQLEAGEIRSSIAEQEATLKRLEARKRDTPAGGKACEEGMVGRSFPIPEMSVHSSRGACARASVSCSATVSPTLATIPRSGASTMADCTVNLNISSAAAVMSDSGHHGAVAKQACSTTSRPATRPSPPSPTAQATGSKSGTPTKSACGRGGSSADAPVCAAGMASTASPMSSSVPEGSVSGACSLASTAGRNTSGRRASAPVCVDSSVTVSVLKVTAIPAAHGSGPSKVTVTRSAQSIRSKGLPSSNSASSDPIPRTPSATALIASSDKRAGSPRSSKRISTGSTPVRGSTSSSNTSGIASRSSVRDSNSVPSMSAAAAVSGSQPLLNAVTDRFSKSGRSSPNEKGSPSRSEDHSGRHADHVPGSASLRISIGSALSSKGVASASGCGAGSSHESASNTRGSTRSSSSSSLGSSAPKRRLASASTMHLSSSTASSTSSAESRLPSPSKSPGRSRDRSRSPIGDRREDPIQSSRPMQITVSSVSHGSGRRESASSSSRAVRVEEASADKSSHGRDANRDNEIDSRVDGNGSTRVPDTAAASSSSKPTFDRSLSVRLSCRNGDTSRRVRSDETPLLSGTNRGERPASESKKSSSPRKRPREPSHSREAPAKRSRDSPVADGASSQLDKAAKDPGPTPRGYHRRVSYREPESIDSNSTQQKGSGKKSEGRDKSEHPVSGTVGQKELEKGIQPNTLSLSSQPTQKQTQQQTQQQQQQPKQQAKARASQAKSAPPPKQPKVPSAISQQASALSATESAPPPKQPKAPSATSQQASALSTTESALPPKQPKAPSATSQQASALSATESAPPPKQPKAPSATSQPASALSATESAPPLKQPKAPSATSQQASALSSTEKATSSKKRQQTQPTPGASKAPQEASPAASPAASPGAAATAAAAVLSNLRQEQLAKEKSLSDVCLMSKHVPQWSSRTLPHCWPREHQPAVLPERNSVQPSGGDDSMSESPPPPSADATADFASYQSSLCAIQSYQWTANFERQFPATTATFNNAVQPQRRLCPYDLRGTCHDSDCPWQHLSQSVSGSGSESRRSQQCPPPGTDTVSTLLDHSVERPTPMHVEDDHSLQATASARHRARGSAVASSSPAPEERCELQVAVMGAKAAATATIAAASHRYFSVEGRAPRVLHELEAHLASSPEDVAAWLKLLRLKQDQAMAKSPEDTVSASLHVLSKALDRNRDSEEIWVPYLQCYAQQKAEDLQKVLDQAVELCPKYGVLQQCMVLSQSYPRKVEACQKVIRHLSASAGGGGVAWPDLSHRVLEAILYLAQVDMLAGGSSSKLQSDACMRLEKYIRPRSVDAGQDKGAKKGDKVAAAYLGRLLTTSDQCIAVLSLLHMMVLKRMPQELYSPTAPQPSLIMCKDFFVIPWHLSQALSTASVPMTPTATPPVSPAQPSTSKLAERVMEIVDDFLSLCRNKKSLSRDDVRAVFHVYQNATALHVSRKAWVKAGNMVNDTHIFMKPRSTSDSALTCLLAEELYILRERPNKIRQMYANVLKNHPSIQASYRYALLFPDKAPGLIFSALEKGFRSCCYKKEFHLRINSMSKRLHLLHFPLGLWTPHDLGLEAECLAPLSNQDRAYLWLMACRWHEKIADSEKYDLYLSEFHGHYEFHVDATYQAALSDLHGTEGEKFVWEEYLLLHRRRLPSEGASPAAIDGFKELCLRAMAAVSPRRAALGRGQQEEWLDYRFHNMIIELYLSSKQPSELMEAYDELLVTFPNNVGLALRAVDHALQQEPLCVDQARHYLATVLASHRTCLDLWKMAIRLELYLGQVKQARWMYQQATQSVPLAASLWSEHLLFEVAHNTTNSPWLAVKKKASEYGIIVKAVTKPKT